MIKRKYIGWYSPTTSHWSKAHILVNSDWLDSSPPITLCGRNPARQHRYFHTVDKSWRVCNQCRKRHNEKSSIVTDNPSLLARSKAWCRRMYTRFSINFRKRTNQVIVDNKLMNRPMGSGVYSNHYY